MLILSRISFLFRFTGGGYIVFPYLINVNGGAFSDFLFNGPEAYGEFLLNRESL